MTSIRGHLFAILLGATCFVWLSALVWIQVSTRAEVERVLDARLAEAGDMVSSLFERDDLAQSTPLDLPETFSDGGSLTHRLSCQIWSLQGGLLGRSSGAPVGVLSEGRDGFENREVDGVMWRVFTITDRDTGIRVMVADSMQVRQRLVADVRAGLLWPGVAVLPLLAFAIWLALRRGMAPVDRLAAVLSSREATDLSPLPPLTAPDELRPVIGAVDSLLLRAGAARQRERDFTAFAAHELKTPLAGLKAQVQVARLAPDDGTLNRALAQIETSVDRTDRMVRQLLDLTRAETAAGTGAQAAAVSEVIQDTLRSLAMKARDKRVSLVPVDRTAGARVSDRAMLAMALRNVVENAIAASPSDAVVTVEALPERIRVMDEGPGIAEDDLPRISERFFRGTSPQDEGSGLGLAIAETALARLGGGLDFSRSAPRGQVVALAFGDGAASGAKG